MYQRRRTALTPQPDCKVGLLFDLCGRADPTRGVDQPGFAALLALAGNGRTLVKLSSLVRLRLILST